MKTIYKPQQIISPFQKFGKAAVDSPLQEEINKGIGSYNMIVEFAKDTQIAQIFPNLENLIAFTCKIAKDGRTVGFGRSASVLGKFNRFIERTVQNTLAAALIDAVVRSKMINSLSFDQKKKESILGDAYKSTTFDADEPATNKQKSYLRELIQINVEDGRERELRISGLEELTKSEASDAIAEFAR